MLLLLAKLLVGAVVGVCSLLCVYCVLYVIYHFLLALWDDLSYAISQKKFGSSYFWAPILLVTAAITGAVLMALN